MVIGLSGMTWLMRLSRMSGMTGINAMTDWDGTGTRVDLEG